MAKVKRLLWLLAKKNDKAAEKKAVLLSEYGYHSIFVETPLQLAAELKAEHASVIVLSERMNPEEMKSILFYVDAIREARGSRKILLLEYALENTIKYAASLAFRDFIPIDLPDSSWIWRMMFAASGVGQNFPRPIGQVEVDLAVKVKTPARIIWLSRNHIRIECFASAKKGDHLLMEGSIARKLGHRELQFEVEEIHQSYLYHRFSKALVGRLKISGADQDVLRDVLEQKQGSAKQNHSNRIYVVVKESRIRQKILRDLEHTQAMIQTAVHIQNLGKEPKYFSPDFIVIEEFFFNKKYKSIMEEMFHNIMPDTVILILTAGENLSDISIPSPKKNLFLLEKKEYLSQVGKSAMLKYLPKISQVKAQLNTESFLLDHKDEDSFGMLSFPSRLMQLHPLVTQLELPVALANYSNLQVYSPILRNCLRKDPWVKCTNCMPSTENVQKFVLDGFYLDLNERENLLFKNEQKVRIEKLLSQWDSNVFYKKFEFQFKKIMQRLVQTAVGDGLNLPLPKEREEVVPVPKLEIAKDTDLIPQDLKELLSLVPAATKKFEAVYDDYVLPVRRSAVKKPVKTAARESWNDFISSDTTYYLAIFVALSILVLTAVIIVVPKLASHFEKSGKVYVDQLMKYSNE